MFRAWILGVVFLFSCATDEGDLAASEESSELAVPAELTPMGGEARTLEACTTPPVVRECCPFPEGCGCMGRQLCVDGVLGACRGATRPGRLCP